MGDTQARQKENAAAVKWDHTVITTQIWHFTKNSIRVPKDFIDYGEITVSEDYVDSLVAMAKVMDLGLSITVPSSYLYACREFDHVIEDSQFLYYRETSLGSIEAELWSACQRGSRSLPPLLLNKLTELCKDNLVFFKVVDQLASIHNYIKPLPHIEEYVSDRSCILGEDLSQICEHNRVQYFSTAYPEFMPILDM